MLVKFILLFIALIVLVMVVETVILMYKAKQVRNPIIRKHKHGPTKHKRK